MARSALPGNITAAEAKEKYGIDLHDPRYAALDDSGLQGSSWPGTPYMVYPGPGEHNEDTRMTIEVLESLGAWFEVRSEEDMAADGTVLPAGHAWPVVDDVAHEVWVGYDPEKLMRKANEVAFAPAPVNEASEAYLEDNSAASPFGVMFGTEIGSSPGVLAGLSWESIRPRDYIPATKSEWKQLTQVHNKDWKILGYVDLGNAKEITTLAALRSANEPEPPAAGEETLYRVGTDRWLLGKPATEAFQLNTSHEISDEKALEWLEGNGWTVIDHVSDFDYTRSETGPVYLRGSILQSIEKGDVIVSEDSSLAEPGKAAVKVVGRSELAGELRQQGDSSTQQPRSAFRDNTLDEEAHHIVETLEISTTEHTTLH